MSKKDKEQDQQCEFAGKVATVIKCGDRRYSPLTREQVLSSLGIGDFYTLSRLGAGQQLLQRNTRKQFLREIRNTLRHGSSVIVVIHHEDCAMYDGSSAFRNYQEERTTQVAQLYQCAGILLKKFPSTTVVLCWHPAPTRGPLEVVHIIRPSGE